MSSRAQEKERRRAERVAAEEGARARERRTRRLRLLAAAAAGALVLAGGAVAVSTGGGDETPAPTAADTTRLYAGIPQDGVVLGRTDAPVTLTEFADLQCPFCRDFSQTALPAIVRDQVRAGRVKLVFRNLDFLGEDSVRAARFAGAAALQDRLFQFVEAFYARQGTENSGYVTDDFLREVAGASGVDADKAFAAMEDPRVLEMVADAEREAAAKGVQSTPSFLVDGRPVAADQLQQAL
jgi:protein-disulfide isomerase